MELNLVAVDKVETISKRTSSTITLNLKNQLLSKGLLMIGQHIPNGLWSI